MAPPEEPSMTDPIDETQPHPSVDPGTPTPGSTASGPTADEPPSPTPGSDPARPLRVDPDRPSDPGWREPAWFPPRDDHDRSHDRRSGAVAIVVGLIFIAVGAWYFLEATLGIDLPRIRWGTLWPVILIAIGGLILVRAVQRKP
jgi:hypothetical protein